MSMADSRDEPPCRLRILHVVESLDRGAVENWLVNVFIESRKTKPDWEWTFFCLIDSPGRLDEKVRLHGGSILRSPVRLSRKTAFLRHLRRTLIDGRYDVLHVHHDYLSGFYLLASAGIPFRKRILHVHNNDRLLPIGNAWLRAMLLPVFRWLSLKLVDEVVSISEFTREDYRRSFRGAKPEFSVLYYGINMDAFGEEASMADVRSELSVPSHALMLLFVGRMDPVKNPLFALDVLSAVLQKGIDAYLVIVGRGELEDDVKTRVEVLRVKDRVRILGWSDRVADLMRSADAFVFPRLEQPREGLGLVLVEAQCAGLPMFITHGIVRDAIEIPELAHWASAKDPGLWADSIVSSLSIGHGITREEAFERMKSSRFELSVATDNLLEHYI
jgi:glycosyltransferase involved in cell wall biosynthesis